MKPIMIKYILLATFALLLLGCPPLSDKVSSVYYAKCTMLFVCPSTPTPPESFKQLYYSTTLSKTALNGSTLGGAMASAVSHDNKNVYVVGRVDNTIAVFTRETSTGALTLLEVLGNGVNGTQQGLNYLVDVIVSPDDKNVYVVSQHNDSIQVFTRAPENGKLTFMQVLADEYNGGTGLERVTKISVSPDGNNIYAASRVVGKVTVFIRNANDGTLTFHEVLTNGGNGVSGLGGAYGIAVSPDGNNVYVASSTDNAVAVFTRDDKNHGKLTYKQMIQDGGIVDGLSGALAITVSPDGNNVYVIGRGDNAVAVFTRNAANDGTLAFLEVFKDHAQTGGTIEGMSGTAEVAVSPDGNNVYVSSAGDYSLIDFGRITSTGSLIYSYIFKYGANGVTGLQGAEGVVVSPDGNNVYVSARTSNTISIFNRR